MNSQFSIAVHCLLLLGMSGTGMANSQDMAESVSTHPARIRKVLGLLRKHGYVSTKEGACGGYQLSTKEEDIRLGDLYRLLSSGSLKPGWCSDSMNADSDCPVTTHISTVMSRVYNGGEVALERYLNGLTLADIRTDVNREAYEAAGPKICDSE